jgi:rod shape-determining protein MreC
MLDIHRRTGYLFLVVVVVEIVVISTQVQTSTGMRLTKAATLAVFSQVQIGSSRMFGGVRHVWDGYFALRGAHEENQQLKDQVAALELRLQQQQALARRGAQLEQMLTLREQTSLRTLTANVIALDATGLFWTVTIDRGSSHGVKPDMAVIAPQGVVGRVVDSPAFEAAKVQLLIDRNAGAGAVIERTGAGGVVVGNDSNPPLQMDFVANLADVKAGDRVVTSGLDGIYPPGFAIGHVEKVEDGQGLYKHIELRPIVDFRALQTVLIVLDPPEKPKPGEGPGELRPAQIPPAATTQNQNPAAAAPATASRPAAAQRTPAQGAPAAGAPAAAAPAGRPTQSRPAPARTTPPPSTGQATPPAATPPAATPPTGQPPAGGTPPSGTTAAPETPAPAPQRPATPPATPPPAAPIPGTPVPGGRQ